MRIRLSLVALFLFSLSMLPASSQSGGLERVPPNSDHPPQVYLIAERHAYLPDHLYAAEQLERIEAESTFPPVVLVEWLTERSEGLPIDREGRLDREVWAQEWGHDCEAYEPVLDWLLANDATVSWLRPDPAYTAEIRNRGPAAAVDRIGEITLGPRAYREAMSQVAGAHHSGSGHGAAHEPVPQEVVNRYFTIQCFWDDFMAWRILEAVKQNPDSPVVVIVGAGHLHPDWGIPWRLQRREPSLRFELLTPEGALPFRHTSPQAP